MKWYNLTADEVLQELDSARSGLPEEKAVERLGWYGTNELREKGAI